MEHNESRMNFFCIDITRPTLYDIGGILFAPLHFFFIFFVLCLRTSPSAHGIAGICPFGCVFFMRLVFE